MNKLYRLMILLLLVGVASAAVYVTTNPEARLFFSRDSPGPEVLPVTSVIRCGEGWSNSCDIGVMDGNVIDKQMYHKNTQAENVSGVVYIEIECAEGLVDDVDGIMDFKTITFTDPYGTVIECNNDTYIERLSANHIKITPTDFPYVFECGVLVFTNVNIEFIDYAYGNYVLTAYVDASPGA